MGIRPGDIVGIALGDDADHIVALLAVAWLGAVILPMDVRWTADEKRRIAVHFGARLVLVPDGGERISHHRDRHLRRDMATESRRP
jgi:acyl-CoA synthetase (AMP-forming)/AMP-acid ligase II